MSHGVVCQRDGCRHFEQAHDTETGMCLAEWGPPGRKEQCDCPALILPADADEQREFSRRITEESGW
jgi:hypothetical protein